jgi:methyl-accepting chemotaxis protein
MNKKGAFNMFTIILITIIAIILIIFFRYLTQKLYEINHHLEKISQGDLTKTLSSNKKSIFKQFSSNINIFILKIRKFITETATLNDKLIDYCKNLSKTQKMFKLL